VTTQGLFNFGAVVGQIRLGYGWLGEEVDTTAHFIAECSALMLLRKNILGDYILSSDTLSNIHWFLLLKFAKACKRFY